MSTFLYSLGKKAYAKPWYAIAGWLVILGLVAGLLGVNGVQVSPDIKIEGTEAQNVLDKLEAELPQAAGGQASVVFTVPGGERLDTPERIGAILEAVNSVYQLEYVINPAELAAAAQSGAMQGDPSAQNGASQGDPAAQSGAMQGDPAAQGDAASAQSSAGSDAQAGASQGDPAAQSGASADAQAGAGQAAGDGAQGQMPGAEMPPYGPLIVDGMPVPGVLVANDGSVGLFQFQFTVQQNSLPDGVTDQVIDTISAVEQGTGITALASDSLKTPDIPIGSHEIIGLAVAAVVLILTLGSLVAAGLPIVIALVGVGIGVGGAFALSTYMPMTSFTPVLALMIGLAVGIDYALFIVNRQRRLILDQGLTAYEAAGRAVGTAGSAVFFAGLTVIIALCGMLVIGISFLSMMALVASATVLVNVLIALTLLPALLGLVGERICSAKARERRQREGEKHGFAERMARGIVRLRWLIIIAVIAVLGVAAIPVQQMELGMPSGATANLDTSARQSYDAISEGFGEGFNGPLLLVAEPSAPDGVIAPEMLGGLVQQLMGYEHVSVVSPLGVNPDGKLAILSLIPDTGPTDAETKELVHQLRDPDSPIAQELGLTLGVTGFTAINIDMSSKLAEVFPLYIGVIVLLSLIILLLVFRSILVPIKATAGFLLSVMATFGITTAVFQWGWFNQLFGFDTGGPLLSFIPIMVTGILYGLAMDYQVFLVSSMREAYVHGHHGNASVTHGYSQASRVVVAAAIIMVAVFAGFIFTDDIMIKQIGFALAIGIFIDAFVIRMALVPAVMAIFGDKAWWLPGWLNRLLPNLDVEGDKLIAKLESQRGDSAR